MDYLTMRLLFPNEAVLKLLEETELNACLPLIAQRDVRPASDVYLTVFILEVEPVFGCGLKLRPISTTVVGITRISSKRLIGDGFLWADTTQDSAAMDLLRAHFRAEEAFVKRALNDIGYQLPSWRNHYRNSAGDLDATPEIVIEDPGPRIWNVSSAQIWKVKFGQAFSEIPFTRNSYGADLGAADVC